MNDLDTRGNRNLIMYIVILVFDIIQLQQIFFVQLDNSTTIFSNNNSTFKTS
jgi:hypothetical protein